MSNTAAITLADHFTGLRSDAIPQKQRLDAKTLLKDYFGVALGGSLTDSAKIAAEFVLQTGGKEEAGLIGQQGKVPAMNAAFANAIASHSIELDDVDVLALFHFSPPIISAALAVAAREGSSGTELISAIVAGCEMMARLSNATNFSLRNRGFHTTPSCGVFGAAIAAARLLKLQRDETVSALGLAGAQASGLMEMYGPSMQKRFNPGPAARSGVTAALMAKLGYTGAATIFEGDNGFCGAFSDEYNLDELTKDLGTDFPVFIEFKPYSCARPIHNAIDCALAVRDELNKPLTAIRSIKMRRHPLWSEYHRNARPSTYHEAQVSLPYAVAVALIEGSALPPQFSNDKLKLPEILRLSDMVEIITDDTLPRGVSCHIEVKTEGGSTLTAQVDHPRGSIENPMTSAEMENKMHMLADPVLGKAQVDELAAAIDDVENLQDVRGLLAIAVPTQLAA